MTDPAHQPVPLILIGGGGHALVVADAALVAGHTLAGFFDDRADAVLARGSPSAVHLGPIGTPDQLAAGLASALSAHTRPGRACRWILAIGDLPARRRLLGGLAGLAPSAATVIHPSAAISPSASIALGTFVGPRAVLHTRAHVESHAIINSAAVIEHECRIGENTHVAPGAVLGGRVRVGADTLIGLGSRVLPNVSIGSGCTVGLGAGVVRDLDPGRLVKGIPAR